MSENNPLEYTGIKWIDRDGSEHSWPCECHHCMTIYPDQAYPLLSNGADNGQVVMGPALAKEGGNP